MSNRSIADEVLRSIVVLCQLCRRYSSRTTRREPPRRLPLCRGAERESTSSPSSIENKANLDAPPDSRHSSSLPQVWTQLQRHLFIRQVWLRVPHRILQRASLHPLSPRSIPDVLVDQVRDVPPPFFLPSQHGTHHLRLDWIPLRVQVPLRLRQRRRLQTPRVPKGQIEQVEEVQVVQVVQGEELEEQEDWRRLGESTGRARLDPLPGRRAGLRHWQRMGVP